MPNLCTDCMIAVHDYEPEMGDDFYTFAPGTCTRCKSDAGVVWTPAFVPDHLADLVSRYRALAIIGQYRTDAEQVEVERCEERLVAAGLIPAMVNPYLDGTLPEGADHSSRWHTSPTS